MSSKNIITQAKEVAARHPDNKAIQSLICQLDLSVEKVKLPSGDAGTWINNPFIGHQYGSMGVEGFYPMIRPDIGFLEPVFDQTFQLYKVGVITECLVTALQALGELIDY